jgi:hypothetical protein
MFLSFPIGAVAFYDGRLGSSYSELVGFPAFIFGIPVGIIGEITLEDAFGMLWVLYLVLFVIALNGPSCNLVQILRRAKNPKLSISKNAAISMVAAFSSVYLLSSIISLIQESYGVRSGFLPEADPLLTFVTISLAPLTEEIGFRVSTIGFFAFAVVSSRGGLVRGLKAIWNPQKHFHPSGQGGWKNLRTLYLIAVVSGVFFGFAHLLYGGGWEIGKVSTASLAGVALGVIYIKFGIPAAILMHWSFNYFRTAYFFFGDGAFGASLPVAIDTIVLMTGVISILFILSDQINNLRRR